MSEPAAAVRTVLDALARGDQASLRLILHPYLHWIDDTGSFRGRTTVLAHLAEHPMSGPPASCELRDGQVYRWTARPPDPGPPG